MRTNRIATLLVAAATVLGATAASAATVETDASPSTGTQLAKVIVSYDGDVTADRLAALERLGVASAFELRSIDAAAVTAAPAVIGRLAQLDGVEAVRPQRKLQLDLYASKEQIGAESITEPGTYDDGEGGSFGLNGYDGSGVTVGIIDSGIFAEHPGLTDKVELGLNFELSELYDQGAFTAEQWDSYAEGTGPSALQDEVGHGTHVAGTVGGTGAGSQTWSQEELRGVAPGVSFVSLKIASAANGVVEDYGFEENALFAIDYLIRHPELGVTVTNNSWGLLPTEPGCGLLGLGGFIGSDGCYGAGEETDYDAANAMVAAAADAGITMVFAAGNDGPQPGSIRPGPGAEQAILVAAACKTVDSSRCSGGQVMTSFSSRGNADGSGPQVDVTAPGDTILAPVSPSMLLPLTECPRPQDEALYYCISGTSMASPHVAGVVALMQEANEDLSPAQAESCLKETARDLLDAGFDIHSGYGMVDTPAAIACAIAVGLQDGGPSSCRPSFARGRPDEPGSGRGPSPCAQGHIP